MMRARIISSLIAAVMVTAVAVACGDPETSDRRGYTKAPLEDPGLFVDGEEPGPLAEVGSPDPLGRRAAEDSEETESES